MSSWDGKVRQLRRTSWSKGGRLRCQEGGPGGGERIAIPIPKEAGEGQGPEAPEERTTATHGEEKEGEAEVTVPEEEGAAQVAMEMAE